MQIAIVLFFLALAIVLFAKETFSVDIITLMLLIGLVLFRILTPEEAFAGFSTDIIIILASIFVISGALQHTGMMEGVGEMLYKAGGGHSTRLIVIMMTVVGLLSAIMNNTTAAAVFVPPVMGLARKAKTSPSKLLMPLAFGSILGGTCTLIGTSTNVAVSGYIARSGLAPISLFEITPVGIVLLSLGILYMATIGHRLLPDHKGDDLTKDYAIREYLSEIVILPGSHMISQIIYTSDLSHCGFRVLEVLRDGQKLLPEPHSTLRENDILLVEGKVQDLIKVKEIAGIEIKTPTQVQDSDLESTDIKLAEALVMPRSDLVDHSLKEVDFRQRYGLAALAIYRQGQSLREKVGHIRLKIGDLLLLQGPAERLKSLRRNPEFWILGELNASLFRKRKGFYMLAFFYLASLLAAWGGCRYQYLF
jgi:di/tricarboxylate transporter